MLPNQTIQGDTLNVLKTFPDESIDCLVTDPPYGLKFMGKDWDKAVPSIEVWRECLRVLKSGSFGFIMCTPRQDCLSRMVVNLEDAGFNTGFTSIYWAYASGFPKAMNIGKMVDKRNNRTSEEFRKFGNYLRQARGNIPQKELAKYFLSKTGGLTGCVANWELGYNVPTKEQWVIIKHILNVGNDWDWLIERVEAEREIIGKDKNWGKRGSTPLTGYREFNVTIPETDKAKRLDGSYGGFQPKPAVEIIIVVMKPLSEKTFTDQALKNGKGVTWLDDCRIPYETDDDKESARFGHQTVNSQPMDWDKPIKQEGKNVLSSSNGRFPANLCCGSMINVDVETLLEAKRRLK